MSAFSEGGGRRKRENNWSLAAETKKGEAEEQAAAATTRKKQKKVQYSAFYVNEIAGRHTNVSVNGCKAFLSLQGNPSGWHGLIQWAAGWMTHSREACRIVEETIPGAGVRLLYPHWAPRGEQQRRWHHAWKPEPIRAITCWENEKIVQRKRLGGWV